MSVFGKIMGAIFGSSAGATPPAGAAAGAATGTAAAPASAPAQTVDVAPILDKAVAAKHEKLEWCTSIVDLMKALDIDSSFAARKELAKELGYGGDTNDSASMNVWLHKQVSLWRTAGSFRLKLSTHRSTHASPRVARRRGLLGPIGPLERRG
jgi:Domain of unknown function (DUF3597)